MSRYDALIAAQTTRIDELETALLGVLDTVSTLADIIAGLKAERLTMLASTTTTPPVRTVTTTRTVTRPRGQKAEKHDKAEEGIVIGTVVRHAGGGRAGYGLLVATAQGEQWVNCVRANNAPALFEGLTEGQKVSYRVKAGGIVVTDDAAKAQNAA